MSRCPRHPELGAGDLGPVQIWLKGAPLGWGADDPRRWCLTQAERVGSHTAPATTRGGQELLHECDIVVCLDGDELSVVLERAALADLVCLRFDRAGKWLLDPAVVAMLEGPPGGVQVECGTRVLDGDDRLDGQVMRVVVALAARRAREAAPAASRKQ